MMLQPGGSGSLAIDAQPDFGAITGPKGAGVNTESLIWTASPTLGSVGPRGDIGRDTLIVSGLLEGCKRSRKRLPKTRSSTLERVAISSRYVPLLKPAILLRGCFAQMICSSFR